MHYISAGTVRRSTATIKFTINYGIIQEHVPDAKSDALAIRLWRRAMKVRVALGQFDRYDTGCH